LSSKQSKHDIQAALLCAGKATRLHPLTITRPLALLPLAGKPLIDHIIRELEDAHIDNIVAVTGYKGNMLRAYLKRIRGAGHDVSAVRQTSVSGTADAVATAAMAADSDMAVLYVDSLIDASAMKLGLEMFQRENADVVMLTGRVADPSAYGVLEVEGDHIIRVLEKPQPRRRLEALVNAGCYFIKRDAAHVAAETATHKVRKEREFTTTIQRLIDDGKLVLSCEIARGRWIDMGRLWNLLDANEHLLMRNPLTILGEIEAGVTVKGKVGGGEGSLVRSGTYLEGPIVIGTSCDIGPNCYVRGSTHIGNNVRVGNGVEIKNSIVMDGTHIEHLSYVGDSIIGERCNLGAGTITANLRLDDKSVKILVKGVVTDSGRRKLGAIVGDGVKTGVNVSLMPGVKLGPACQIGPHLKVEKDVEPNTFHR